MNNHRNNLTSHIVVVFGLDDLVPDPELPAELLHHRLVGAGRWFNATRVTRRIVSINVPLIFMN